MTTIQSKKEECGVVGTTLRLPRHLRDDMKIQAIRAGRSFNTHVVMILHDAIKREPDQPNAQK